jgi:uncharacterized protein (DUF2336 family)
MLLDLARESSSDKRRELLRDVTDVLLSDPAALTGANCAVFDDIVGTVLSDLTNEVRAELSRTLADAPLPLGKSARQLAMDDEIEIARAMIERSSVLSDNDLLEVVTQKSQAHLMAVTKRRTLGERVSAALVDHGEDKVVASLLSNAGTRIDRATYEKVAERAQTSAIIQTPFVQRASVPLDLLNDVYASVSTNLRQEILKRYECVSPDEFEAALERSKNRLAKVYGALPKDFEQASRALKALERNGDLKPVTLVRLMREGPESRTLFLLSLAKLTDADYASVVRVFDAQDVDALALLCRAANFERALFMTLSLGVVGDSMATAKIEGFGGLYDKVPVLSAQRAIRFWKVRAAG